MCGLVGVASRKGITEYVFRKEYFRDALLVDTLRGEDSTGICLVPLKEGADTIMYKKAMAGPDFLQLKIVNNLLIDMDKYVFALGHNRAATRGVVSNNNAHPFHKGNIVLMHNGTLDAYRHLSNTANVDSEAICHAFNENGADATLPELEGAYALTWVDLEDNSLHFARNQERPLSFGITEDKKTLLWASERWMVKHLAQRKNVKISKLWDLPIGQHVIIQHNQDLYDDLKSITFKPKEKKVISYGNFQETSPGGKKTHGTGGSDVKPSTSTIMQQLGIAPRDTIIFSWAKWEKYSNGYTANHGKIVGYASFGKGVNSEFVEVVVHSQPKTVISDEDKYIAVVGGAFLNGTNYVTINATDFYAANQYNTPFAKNRESWEELDKQNAESKAKKAMATAPEAGTKAVVKMVRGPGNQFITVEEFDKLTKEGCSHCSGNLFHDEAYKVVWTQDKQPICPDCVGVLNIGSTGMGGV